MKKIITAMSFALLLYNQNIVTQQHPESTPQIRVRVAEQADHPGSRLSSTNSHQTKLPSQPSSPSPEQQSSPYQRGLKHAQIRHGNGAMRPSSSAHDFSSSSASLFSSSAASASPSSQFSEPQSNHPSSRGREERKKPESIIDQIARKAGAVMGQVFTQNADGTKSFPTVPFDVSASSKIPVDVSGKVEHAHYHTLGISTANCFKILGLVTAIGGMGLGIWSSASQPQSNSNKPQESNSNWWKFVGSGIALFTAVPWTLKRYF